MCKASTASLEDAHFRAMGDRGEGRNLTAEANDGVVDGTGNTRSLGGHGGHNGRVAAEEI